MKLANPGVPGGDGGLSCLGFCGADRLFCAAGDAVSLFDLRQTFITWMELSSPASRLQMLAPGLLLAAFDDGSVRLVG
ncbi:hypothetical protein MNEG_5675 [Monoraphidium neglectum]|uniref:Uncharacterized protein n=1 Tax=Monoraphidium neglectum TaxID=145388 RepID=A0A0D2MGT0_9CHLO|nr:hypothetical protein MNEG_5675 [Monoraphidium neglectum]KIZ02280.1 hypothetical protein MNEG_5675 [Monoraphidium neglectum]|eukprot:XP_013901299.1 hypothetical protein MNEG_5675 [Monoraphidium neglectum]